MSTSARSHWQAVYERRRPDELSWFEPVPERSLALIEGTALPRDAAILDVGGGASTLAAELLAAGYGDITVADISSAALDHARRALGDRAAVIKWLEADIRSHDFGRQFDLWHDRAVLHFMVEADDRDAYLAVLKRALRVGGYAVIATFGPDGPTRCSGLPVNRYGAAELATQLGPEFEQLGAELVVHRAPSGLEQQFLYSALRRLDVPER